VTWGTKRVGGQTLRRTKHLKGVGKIQSSEKGGEGGRRGVCAEKEGRLSSRSSRGNELEGDSVQKGEKGASGKKRGTSSFQNGKGGGSQGTGSRGEAFQGSEAEARTQQVTSSDKKSGGVGN